MRYNQSDLGTAPFRSGSGVGAVPDIIVGTDIDPETFKRKFGKGEAAVTHVFAFKGNREWAFHSAENLETIKVTIVKERIVIAVTSEEIIGKFLAFVEQTKTPG